MHIHAESISPFLTLVPHPNRNPTPIVAAAEAKVCGGRGYVGIKDGASRYTGRILDIKPATMGTLSRLGLKAHPDTKDEMPKTAPLWKRRPDEPWKSIKAPRDVLTGVNILSVAATMNTREISQGELELWLRVDFDF